MFAAVIDRLPPRTVTATQNLVLVASIELARQTVLQLRRFLPERTVELDQGRHEASGTADITVATVQTLVRRLEKYDPRRFKLVVIDEAHHAAANTYVNLLEHFDPGALCSSLSMEVILSKRAGSKARFEEAQRLVKWRSRPMPGGRGQCATLSCPWIVFNALTGEASAFEEAETDRDSTAQDSESPRTATADSPTPSAPDPSELVASGHDAPWVVGFTATFKCVVVTSPRGIPVYSIAQARRREESTPSFRLHRCARRVERAY